MRHRLERAAMDRARSKFMKLGQVQFSAVTFVLFETILRKTRAKVTHHPIARYLRDDAGRGDAQTLAIAIHDRRLRKGKWKNRQTVDEDMIGRINKRSNGRAHCFMRRAQDVDPVDFEVIDYADCPEHLGVARKINVNFFSELRGELLGII